MKAIFSLALLLALAPVRPGAAAEPPASAPAADAQARAAARAWLEAKGIACTPDAFVALAATAGPECIAQFLAAGLDANTRDSQGTPALVATLSGWQNLKRPEFNSYRDKLVNDRLEVLALLLARGADPNARDRRGCMAIHHAAAYGLFWPAIATLKRAGSELECGVFGSGLKPLQLAIATNNPFGARALLEAGASPNGEADPKQASLVNAIELDHPLLVEVLLTFGADPKVQLPGGVSCLHLAAAKACLKTIQCLVAAGADRQAQDAQHRSPYDTAKAHDRGPEVLAALAPAA